LEHLLSYPLLDNSEIRMPSNHSNETNNGEANVPHYRLNPMIQLLLLDVELCRMTCAQGAELIGPYHKLWYVTYFIRCYN
jgi:hypothetical protein